MSTTLSEEELVPREKKKCLDPQTSHARSNLLIPCTVGITCASTSVCLEDTQLIPNLKGDTLYLELIHVYIVFVSI